MAAVYIKSCQLAHESINVNLAIELGSESMIKFEKSLTEWFEEKISWTIIPQSEGKTKTLKVGESK